jgi:hypothetical protein
VGDKRVEDSLAVIGKIKERHGKQRGVAGSLKCPVCNTGTVFYSVAPLNGHIWARCNTKGCVAFMQ